MRRFLLASSLFLSFLLFNRQLQFCTQASITNYNAQNFMKWRVSEKMEDQEGRKWKGEDIIF